MNWLELIKAIVPIILTFSGRKELAALAPVVTAGIIQAEHLKDAKGPEKLAYVQNLITIGAMGYNAAKGENAINMQMLNESSTAAINTAIQVANIITKK